MTARLAVRLVPRGGADRVDGVGEDGVLRARVAAPPVEGAANEALWEKGIERTVSKAGPHGRGRARVARRR